MRSLTTTITTLTAAIWLTGIAQAVTPADKCEADKLKRAGKYSFCRLKAESKAVKTGNAPNYSLCNVKLSEKWTNAEIVGGGQCPTNGDLTPMQARMTSDANDVAACLNGTCPPSCGDAIANGAEWCDGADLDGESCISVGFASGTLTCTAGCGFDVSGCQSQSLPATGQTTCWNSAGTVIPCAGTGQDGDVQAGATLAYTDNGDGTITDANTGLMWEKLDDNNVGGIHDWDNTYTWDDAFAVKIATLNAGGGFAGHTDWRLPNLTELESIRNLQNGAPSVSATFNTACAPGCTVSTCSCTQWFFYWSSSTWALSPSGAWYVDFYGGIAARANKVSAIDVRAVRAGS